MADLDEAIEAAARLLSKSTLPVIAGLQTDVAGAVAALKLARQIGGVVDHVAAETSLRDQAVLNDAGLMMISPAEARRVAETVLIVGDGPLRAWPDLTEFFAGDAGSGSSRARRTIAFCEDWPADAGGDTSATHVKYGADALPGALAALRARVNGRPVAGSPEFAGLDRVAAALKAACFGVAIWSPDELDALTIEMLAGLIKDLNEHTRWSGFSVIGNATVAAAATACAWIAGLPLRSSFAQGEAEHDAWRFEARRLVESGETDTVIWIGGDPPDWLDRTNAIVLSEASAVRSAKPRIRIEVGTPGVDHAAIVHDRRSATLVNVAASKPTKAPSAADVLNRIAEKLGAP